MATTERIAYFCGLIAGEGNRFEAPPKPGHLRSGLTFYTVITASTAGMRSGIKAGASALAQAVEIVRIISNIHGNALPNRRQGILVFCVSS